MKEWVQTIGEGMDEGSGVGSGGGSGRVASPPPNVEQRYKSCLEVQRDVVESDDLYLWAVKR